MTKTLLLLLLSISLTSCNKLDEETAKKTVGDFITYLQFDNAKGIQEVYPSFWLEQTPIIHSYEVASVVEKEGSFDVMVNTKLGAQGQYDQKMTFTVVEELGKIIIESSYGMSKYTWESFSVTYESAKKYGWIYLEQNFDVQIDSICSIISDKVDVQSQSIKKFLENGWVSFEPSIKRERFDNGSRFYGSVAVKSPNKIPPYSYAIFIDYLGSDSEVLYFENINSQTFLDPNNTTRVNVEPNPFKYVDGAVSYKFRCVILNDSFIKDWLLESGTFNVSRMTSTEVTLDGDTVEVELPWK